MEAKPGLREFTGLLIFDGGRTCEGVTGRIGEDQNPRHASPGRKVFGGTLHAPWTRETFEVLGLHATLQTSGGLKARISLKSIRDDEQGQGAFVEFDTVGSPISGSYDQP